MEWQILNATLVCGSWTEKTSGLHIKNGRIERRIQLEDASRDLPILNLYGFFVFPGLINAHDSLLASYYVFRGTNHPYLNWLGWDNELKASLLFRKRMLLEPVELYQLGSYRNILSGVTTVVDHIPKHVRRPFEKQLLPRLLPDFGISHSSCSYSLQWGRGIRQEYEYALENDLPYIIHIAEGFDQENHASLQKLKEAGALGEHTVLVHGLSLSLKDLDEIAKAGAHIVWCPVSNCHIYQKTAPIKEILERNINVCLGSEAAMYGSQNLLHDIRFAASYYQEHYEQALKANLLLEMVTTNPARAFRLKNYCDLEAGSPADFIVLKGKYPDDPFSSFQEAGLDDLYLVVRDGEALYGSSALKQIFSSNNTSYERFKLNGEPKIIKKHGSPLKESLKKLMEKVCFEKPLDFMPISTV